MSSLLCPLSIVRPIPLPRGQLLALALLSVVAGCGGRSGLESPVEAGGLPDAALADRSLWDLRPEMRRDTQPSPDAKGPGGTSWALAIPVTYGSGDCERVAVDGAGNAYIAAYFYGTIVIGGISLQSTAGSALSVAKLSPQGKVLWATAARGKLGYWGYPCNLGLAASSSGEAWITGTFSETATFGSTTLTSSGQGDIYVARLSPQGKFSWAVAAGGNSPGTGGLHDVGAGVAVDGAGNGYVTGYFNGTARFGSFTLKVIHSAQTFVARLSPQGTFLWAVAAGGSIDDDGGCDIAVDAAGYSAVTGYFHNKWTGGSLTLSGAFGSDIFVTRLDPQGKFLWATAATGQGSDDEGRHVALDGGGRTHLSGVISGTVKLGPFTLSPKAYWGHFVARLDGKGAFEQAQILESGGLSIYSAPPGGLATDGAGNVHLAGTFSNQMTLGKTKLTSAGQKDVYVARLNPSGQIDWAISAGGKLYDSASDIAADNWGNRYVVGTFEDQATFGKTALSGNGEGILFIWRISSAGY